MSHCGASAVEIQFSTPQIRGGEVIKKKRKKKCTEPCTCVCLCQSFLSNGFLPRVFLAGRVGDLDKWDGEQVNYCSQAAHRDL